MLQLPPEILHEIFSTIQISYPTDAAAILASCALVCQRLRLISQQYLFKDIGCQGCYILRGNGNLGCLRTQRIKKMAKLAEALQNNSRLVQLIDVVSISITFLSNARPISTSSYNGATTNIEPEMAFISFIDSLIPNATFSHLKIHAMDIRGYQNDWNDFSPHLQNALVRLFSASRKLRIVDTYDILYIYHLFPLIPVDSLARLTMKMRPSDLHVDPSVRGAKSDIWWPKVRDRPLIIQEYLRTSSYGAWLLDQKQPNGVQLLDTSSTRKVLITVTDPVHLGPVGIVEAEPTMFTRLLGHTSGVEELGIEVTGLFSCPLPLKILSHVQAPVLSNLKVMRVSSYKIADLDPMLDIVSTFTSDTPISIIEFKFNVTVNPPGRSPFVPEGLLEHNWFRLPTVLNRPCLRGVKLVKMDVELRKGPECFGDRPPQGIEAACISLRETYFTEMVRRAPVLQCTIS